MARITNLHALAGASKETTTIEDPFGAGMTFEVRSSTYPPFVNFMHSAAKKSDSLGKAASSLAAKQLREGKSDLNMSKETLEEEMATLLEEGRINVLELLGDEEATADAVSRFLITRWDGVTDAANGQKVAFSRREAFDLLTYKAKASSIDPKFGEHATVGQILLRTILAGAAAKASAMRAAEEEAEGNSEGSSSGDSGSATKAKSSDAE